MERVAAPPRSQPPPDILAARLAAVRARIARAAEASGRDPAGVRLVAVSKTYPAAHVRAAAEKLWERSH